MPFFKSHVSPESLVQPGIYGLLLVVAATYLLVLPTPGEFQELLWLEEETKWWGKNFMSNKGPTLDTESFSCYELTRGREGQARVTHT